MKHNYLLAWLIFLIVLISSNNLIANTYVERELSWLKKNSKNIGLYLITEKEEIHSTPEFLTDSVYLEHDNDPIYLYKVNIIDSIMGDTFKSFCTKFKLNASSKYLLFLGNNTAEGEHIKSRTLTVKLENCNSYLVGGHDGLYKYEVSNSEEKLVYTAPQSSIINNRCILKHGLREEHSIAYSAAISYNYFRKLILWTGTTSKQKNCECPEKE